MFKAVRAGVRTDSKSQQVPWESTSLESAFRFREAVAEKRAPPPAPKAPPPAKAARAIPASLRAPPNFAVGDTWTYRLVNELDQTERPFVVRVKDLRGDEVIYGNGSVGDLFGNQMRSVLSGARVDTFEPSNHYYVFPLKSGSSFSFKAVQTSGERVMDLDITIKVGDEEEVDTPAGRMRGVRIDREARWKQRKSDNGGINRRTYWYSSAVKRFVLTTQSNISTTGKVLVRERAELVSYSLK